MGCHAHERNVGVGLSRSAVEELEQTAQGRTGWKVCVERGEVRGEVGITVIGVVGFHRFSYSVSGNRHGVRYRKTLGHN